MALEEEQIRKLLSAVARTGTDEIDCDTCLAGMAEFAEQQLVGTEVPQALARIAAHIEDCPECAEEYRALFEIVSASGAQRGD